MSFVRAVLLLTIVYLFLTANLQPINILVGLLLGLGAALLVGQKGRPTRWRDTPRSLSAGIRYLAVLAYDIFVSGIQVARIVLDPRLPIKPGVIAIPSQCESDLGTALSAHAISLTPGELVVEIGMFNEMYTHVLDATHAADFIAEAQELREELLGRIFP